MEPSNNTELLSGIRNALDRLDTLVGTGDESRDRMGKHAERLEKRIQRIEQFIDGSSMSCAQMSERLEKLEDVVSKEMAKVRERTIPWINADDLPSTTPCSPDPGVAHVAPSTMWNNIGYNIALDPKASPTGIPFSVALEYLKAGREVRRKSWSITTHRIQPHGPGGVGGMYVIAGASVYVGDFQPALSDMLATDWEVVPS